MASTPRQSQTNDRRSGVTPSFRAACNVDDGIEGPVEFAGTISVPHARNRSSQQSPLTITPDPSFGSFSTNTDTSAPTLRTEMFDYPLQRVPSSTNPNQCSNGGRVSPVNSNLDTDDEMSQNENDTRGSVCTSISVSHYIPNDNVEDTGISSAPPFECPQLRRSTSTSSSTPRRVGNENYDDAEHFEYPALSPGFNDHSAQSYIMHDVTNQNRCAEGTRISQKRSMGQHRDNMESEGGLSTVHEASDGASSPPLRDGGLTPDCKRRRAEENSELTLGRRCTANDPPGITSSQTSLLDADTSGFPPASEGEQGILPHYADSDAGWNSVIQPETMKDILDNKYDTPGREFRVVDCRFQYEFEGGHIRGAENFMDPFDVQHYLFPPDTDKKQVFIFHCEFSSKRAPKMCKAMRSLDRSLVGLQNYPKLYVPELYLLAGGYKNFFEKFPEYCTPQGYVRMDANAYDGMRKEMQTYVDGQHSEFERTTGLGRCRKSDQGLRRVSTLNASPPTRVCSSTSGLELSYE